MKLLLALCLAFGFTTVFAQTTTEKPKTEMKLAKKKADKDREAKEAKEAKDAKAKEAKDAKAKEAKAAKAKEDKK
jgi:hypothetical protein